MYFSATVEILSLGTYLSTVLLPLPAGMRQLLNSSPFLLVDLLYYNISGRPHSVLERGGTRPGTSNVNSITEADESGFPSPTASPRNHIKASEASNITRSEVRAPSS